MHRILLTFLGILLALSVTGQTKLGIFISNDNTSFTGDKPPGISYKFGTGAIIGLKAKIPLQTDVWLSIEPSYVFGNANIHEKDTVDTSLSYDHHVSNRLLSLPVRLNVYITPGFYASAGIEVSYFTRSDMERFDETIDLLDNFYRINVSLSFGIGYSIPIGNCSLDIELSHIQTVNKLSKKTAEEYYVPRIRLTSTRASLSFLIPINSKHEE